MTTIIGDDVRMRSGIIHTLRELASDSTITTTSGPNSGHDYALAVQTSDAGDDVTITLISNPADGRTYNISDIDGNANNRNIVFNGNGKNVNGSSTQTISTSYNSYTLIYSSSAGHWNII